MELNSINVCSYWEELCDVSRTALRLLGERVPTEDPREGELILGYKNRGPLYAYISHDGHVQSLTKEEVNAQMRTDKNTYTVSKL